jgi:hypothetical protein
MTFTEDHVYGLICIGLAIAAHYGIRRFKAARAGLCTASDPLDSELLRWSRNDAFTVRDLLNGGVAIFGRTGSGKTSSSGKALANGIVRCVGSGGLILAAKPEDRAMWEGIFKAAGRSDDLLVFSPEHPLRFNFLDWENTTGGGHTRNITKCITVIGETLRSSDTTAGENADFWQREQERLIFNAVEIVKQATGRVGAPDAPFGNRHRGMAKQVPQPLPESGLRAGQDANGAARLRHGP